MQVEAERRKRAAILESEGVREADINVAEGKRQARILASEAQRMEQINHANGEAAAMLAVADARAKGLNIISKSLMQRVSRSNFLCKLTFCLLHLCGISVGGTKCGIASSC